MHVQYLHCDNAGKNVVFKKACKQEGLGMDFEYTAQGMPQQNGYVEQKFTTLFMLYVQCSVVENSMLFYETAYGLKPKTLPYFLKTIF